MTAPASPLTDQQGLEMSRKIAITDEQICTVTERLGRMAGLSNDLAMQFIARIAIDKAEIERLTALADKYKWQVIDTCARAEKAEAQLEFARARMVVSEAEIYNVIYDFYWSTSETPSAKPSAIAKAIVSKFSGHVIEGDTK